MASSMISRSRYSYSRENAKFFSQELIEFILFDFGHIWRPERSDLEIKLRKASMFVFWPSIGRFVAYISRKYSGFVVVKSFESWKFINNCRASTRKQLLCNGIVNLCVGHELDHDDLGLFTFLAIVAEYARLAITYKQENLIDTVVHALSFCLTNVLSGGFVPTLNRLKSLVSNFKYPRNYVMCDYDPETLFLSPVSTDPMVVSRSEVESPICLEFNFPSSLHRTPPEDVMTQLKIRKVHRELFRRQMMTDQATQTEIKSDHNVNTLECFVRRSKKIKDLLEKIKVNNSNSPLPDATFSTVEMYDVHVQTWSSGEQVEKLRTETGKVEARKTGETSAGTYSVGKHASDLNDVIEKLKTLEKISVKDPMPDISRCFDDREINVQKSEARKGMNETNNLSNSFSAVYGIPLELDPDMDEKSSVRDKSMNPESLLRCSEIKCVSEMDSSNGESFNDSEFKSLAISTDGRTKIRNKRHSRKDSNSDSQSLEESI